MWERSAFSKAPEALAQAGHSERNVLATWSAQEKDGASRIGGCGLQLQPAGTGEESLLGLASIAEHSETRLPSRKAFPVSSSIKSPARRVAGFLHRPAA